MMSSYTYNDLINNDVIDHINSGDITILIHCVFYSLQLFAWLGFAVAIVWIYSLANEIVNMLQVSCGMKITTVL